MPRKILNEKIGGLRSSQSRIKKGIKQQQQGLHEEAVRSFDRAMEIDRTAIKVLRNKASNPHRQSHPEKAILAAGCSLRGPLIATDYFTSPINIGIASRLRAVSPLNSSSFLSGTSPRSPKCWPNLWAG